MGSTLNMVYSGGGLFPTLVVTITNGTATGVTATLGSKVVNLAYDSSTGVWRGTLIAFGTWTVEATDGETTVSDMVDVVSVTVYTANLSFSPLPNGYTELEYVESSGNSYFTTDITLTSNGFRFVGDIMPTTFKTGVYQSDNIFGATNSNAGYGNSLCIHNYVGKAWIEGDKSYSFTSPFATNTKYSIDASNIFNNVFYKIDGVSQVLTQASNKGYLTDKKATMFVGADYYAGDARYERTFIGRMYECRIYESYDNSLLIGHFIPAKRNSDNAVGMYDVTRNTFYPSATSTAFVAGPEV